MESEILPKDMFNNMIKEQVKPLMKAYQFKKKGLTFYYNMGDLCYVINFQKSMGNYWQSLRFFINCGIYSREIVERLELFTEPVPKEYKCHYRLRISNLTDKDYGHYTFNIDGEHIYLDANQTSCDPEWIIKQVMEDLQVAIPKLLEIRNTDELIDIMLNFGGLADTTSLEHYLLKTNQVEKFQTYYDNLYKSFGHEERWQIMKQRLDELKYEILGAASKRDS